jgi:hypothetical protein
MFHLLHSRTANFSGFFTLQVNSETSVYAMDLQQRIFHKAQVYQFAKETFDNYASATVAGDSDGLQMRFVVQFHAESMRFLVCLRVFRLDSLQGESL